MAKKYDRQEEINTDRLVSRRDFLVAGKSVIAAGTVGACTTRAAGVTQTSRAAEATATTTKIGRTGSWLLTKWGYEADVVVAGYGGAGACAAITAHDAGAKVIIGSYDRPGWTPCFPESREL
jgi:glutamate dehydrogenase/leucine dehydrogenase